MFRLTAVAETCSWSEIYTENVCRAAWLVRDTEDTFTIKYHNLHIFLDTVLTCPRVGSA
jgi:hypothetical protein